MVGEMRGRSYRFTDLKKTHHRVELARFLRRISAKVDYLAMLSLSSGKRYALLASSVRTDGSFGVERFGCTGHRMRVSGPVRSCGPE